MTACLLGGLLLYLPIERLLWVRLPKRRRAVEVQLRGRPGATRWFRLLSSTPVALVVLLAGVYGLLPAYDEAIGDRILAVSLASVEGEPAPPPTRAAMVTERLAMQPGDVGQRPWTLLSYALLHVSAGHLASTLLALMLFGLAIDYRIGRLRCLVIVLASVLAGALAHLLFADGVVLLGASAGVFGLSGASLALLPRREMVWGIVAAKLPNYVGIPVLVVLYGVIVGLGVQGFALGAHLGGFAAGVLLALALRKTPVPPVFVQAEAARTARLNRVAR